MKFYGRFVAIAASAMMLLGSVGPIPGAAQQPPPPAQVQIFDQYVARVREQLGLGDEQVAALRQLLSGHGARLAELRRRSQAQAYSLQLISDIDREQRAIRDEMTGFLTEEQKAKLATVDVRLPIAPPAFALINIPARSRMGSKEAAPLAAGERLLPAVASPSRSRIARLSEDQKSLHLLNRITFGPRPGDLERLRQMGIDKFLDQQLHPETIDDADLERRLAVLPTLQLSSAELYQYYPPGPVLEQRLKDKNTAPVFGTPRQIMGELTQQKLVRSVSSERQLQEVMTDFWFNHFNVFGQKDAEQWLLMSYERDVIRPRALGKFRDLLLGVAESPAMLFYLDNWLSASPDSRPPRPPAPAAPNPTPGPPRDAVKPPVEAGSMAAPAQTAADKKTAEAIDPASLKPKLEDGQSKNGSPQSMQPPAATPPPPRPPARKPGINENYARELMELHTMGVDGGYSQKDVQEVARCFTGWTIDRPNQGGSFVFRPWMHDTGAKTVLGVTIPAGGGITDAERVIEILSRHPSTARFVSKKLCQRFVSDSPPAQLVERISQVFLRTDGEIREVLRAIFTSPEFNSASSFRSKVKSPLELVASAIRAVDGDTNGAPVMYEWLRKMGEPLYLNPAPTGYSEQSGAWMNTGSFLARLNFLVAFTRSQIAGTSYDPARLVSPDMALNINELTNRLTALLLHTDLSPESLRTIRAGLEKVQGAQSGAAVRTAATSAGKPEVVTANYVQSKMDSGAARVVGQVLELMLGCSEFQRR